MLIIIYFNFFHHLKDFSNYINSAIPCLSKNLLKMHFSQLLDNLTNLALQKIKKQQYGQERHKNLP